MNKTGIAGLTLLILLGSTACGDDEATVDGMDGVGAGDIGGSDGTGAGGDTGGSTATGTGGDTGGSGGSGATGGSGGGDPVLPCGDGTQDADEECDDGNLRSHDGCSSGCTVETPTWTQLSPSSSPPRRTAFGMAYDESDQVTVIYGGIKTSGMFTSVTGETWEYDREANAWAEIDAANPPPALRGNAMAMGENSNGDWLVSLGGAEEMISMNGTDDMDRYWPSADSWLSFGGPRPSARVGHAMVWDSTNGRTIMFGGYHQGTPLDDTHAMADSWSNLDPATRPSARHGHAMAYDSARDMVVLFGGTTTMGESGSTYEFDGATDLWANANPADSPLPRTGATMIYDPIREVTVLFGGFINSSGLADTWEYDGTTWTQISTSEAPPASAHMVYDSRYHRAILLGDPGTGTEAETWEYRATSDHPDEVCDAPGDEDEDGLEDCDDPDCDGLPCG